MNTSKRDLCMLITAILFAGMVFLEPYYRNLGKRLVKTPKIYMCDTGLAAFLMGFETPDEMARHPVMGALWETHVVMQVVRHYGAYGRHLPLWYWRTVHGAEVDLLVEKGGRFTAIEAKYTEHPDTTDLKGINALEKVYGRTSLISGYVASRTARSYPLSDTVQAVNGSDIDRYIP